MKRNLPIILILIFLTIESEAQDWPNLNRFQKANLELGSPKPNEDRVVFIGNSITEGWLAKRPLFFKDKPYVNRGISGQTTPQMLLRFRQDVIKLKPAVVVILAGINDIAGNTGPTTVSAIADNILSMGQLAASNNIEVVLCSVLPASYFPWKPDLKPGNLVLELNGRLKKIAAEHNWVYVDYHSNMVNPELGLKKELGYDGVHPNAKGYFIMEPLVEAGILMALDTQE
jgi:lysophospholipase L1-like esterase